MVTNLLVMFPLEAGKKLVELLDQEDFNLIAAFWGYQPEADEWRLYVCTPLVASEGPRKVYERIRELLENQQPPLDLALGDIAAVSPNDSLIRDIRGVLRVQPGEPVKRLGRNKVEGIEEAYVYRML